MNPEEIQIIRGKYEFGVSKLNKTILISLFLGVSALLAPEEVWQFIGLFRKRIHRNDSEVSGTMVESLGVIQAFCLVASIILVVLLITYFVHIHYYKKDLATKEKVCGEVRVTKIEHLSRAVAEKLDGLDTVLHFEPNKQKISKKNFNKQDRPDLLNAKSVVVEIAKYSGYEFKCEIIS